MPSPLNQPLRSASHYASKENHLSGRRYPHSLYGPYWRPTRRTITIDGIETPYHDSVFWSGVATVAYLPSTAFPAAKGRQSGLPIGLQLIGARLFAVSHAFHHAKLNGLGGT